MRARAMFAIAEALDARYLRRRVGEETGEEALVALLEPFAREDAAQP
jgi:hypothetical protein